MKVKSNASIAECRPEILIAAITIISPVFTRYGQEAVITSGTELYEHSAKRSAHYRGDALDFRTRWFDEPTKKKLANEIKEELGDNFVVVLERTHLHIHYGPMFAG